MKMQKKEVSVKKEQMLQLTLETLRSKFEFSFLLLFITYRRSGEKLIKYQSNLWDHVHNSHDHSVVQSIDITRRNSMLITLRA